MEVEVPAECLPTKTNIEMFPHKVWNNYAATKDGQVYHISSGRLLLGYINNTSQSYKLRLYSKGGRSRCLFKAKFVYEILTGSEVPKGSEVIHRSDNLLDDRMFNLFCGTKSQHACLHQHQKSA
ncbi:hypothetical protein ACJMK2_040422, partial [Sinanodonta woodiana]